jgi:3-phosphoshikimate 1-carboxyvinyltransferase
VTITVEPAARIRARIAVPADKSISHRALLFNAIASGPATVENLLDAADVRSTAACLRSLGVEIDWSEGAAQAVVHGRGLHGLFEGEDVLDCGNSGTTMRLLSGLLAAHPILSVLTGDGSLRRRPMARIVTPLRAMGATVFGRKGDTVPPLVIKGGDLRGVRYRSPVASAQVKSAMLLAGLYADGPTTIDEPARSRDHSERLLEAMGASLRRDGTAVTIEPASRLDPVSIRVPGDISSAAPWLVLGACHPDAEVTVEGVNINPTRTGILDILTSMGAEVSRHDERVIGGEPVANITVRSNGLRATEVGGDIVPRAIDELPLVALLACFAEGTTIVRDAAELRAKESDRVDAVVRVLGQFGARVSPRDDGFVVDGPARLHGATVDAGHDHRIGMLAGLGGVLAATGPTRIVNDAVGVSYPAFWTDLARAAG